MLSLSVPGVLCGNWATAEWSRRFIDLLASVVLYKWANFMQATNGYSIHNCSLSSMSL